MSVRNDLYTDFSTGKRCFHVMLFARIEFKGFPASLDFVRFFRIKDPVVIFFEVTIKVNYCGT